MQFISLSFFKQLSLNSDGLICRREIARSLFLAPAATYLTLLERKIYFMKYNVCSALLVETDDSMYCGKLNLLK